MYGAERNQGSNPLPTACVAAPIPKPAKAPAVIRSASRSGCEVLWVDVGRSLMPSFERCGVTARCQRLQQVVGWDKRGFCERRPTIMQPLCNCDFQRITK